MYIYLHMGSGDGGAPPLGSTLTLPLASLKLDVFSIPPILAITPAIPDRPAAKTRLSRDLPTIIFTGLQRPFFILTQTAAWFIKPRTFNPKPPSTIHLSSIL